MSQNKYDQNQENLGFLRDMIEAVKADAPEESEYIAARRSLLQKLETDKKENLIMSTIRKAVHTKFSWATATGIAILLIALVVVFNPFGRGPSQAYAAVVEQLRNALTVSFSAVWYFDENEPPTHIEMAYREPGIQRVAIDHNGSHIIQVLDTNRDKGIVLMPETKTCIEMDLASMPSVERDRIQLINLVSKEIKTLPDRADEILGEQVIDGREVQGFRVSDQTIWIDVETQELISVDRKLGGTRMVMSEFRIDPDDLDDSMFSTTPPEDYTPISKEAVAYDVSKPGEQDLIEYLRTVANLKKDHRFPATVNPMELLTLEKEGMLVEDEPASPEEEQKEIQAFAKVCQKTVMFVVNMKPENDWHYAGKGVEYGDSATPIAWWKSDGSETYRVIWGDLSATNVAAEDIPQVSENNQ